MRSCSSVADVSRTNWGWVLAEYRLEELARVSGVSVRNIRAYRERGLLDPPRRDGRAALYDDYHLSQLNTISQLLSRGYNSAHIAEFFSGMRKGNDLADILGLQRAVLGPRDGEGDDEVLEPHDDGVVLALDTDDARKLVAYGLAEIVAGKVKLTDGPAAEILIRAPDPQLYVRPLLRLLEASDESVDDLAEGFVASLVDMFQAHGGPEGLRAPVERAQVEQMVEDYRELVQKVVASKLDQATRRYLVASASDQPAGIPRSGELEPSRGA